MVSVILVNFNGFQDTVECVKSIKESDNKDFRIIVVDNHSTDDSVVSLRGVQDGLGFILIESTVNNGFSAGNNLGIKKALELGTDYIWLLNNDTLIEANAIDELIEGFSFSSRVGVTIGKILYEKNRDTIWYAGGAISRSTARTEHWRYNEKDTDDIEKQSVVSFATGCCVFMSVDALKRIGFMDEDYFLYEEDADYSIRIREKGIDIVYCPQARIYHKVSASTGVASPIAQYYTVRNKYRLISKHYRGWKKYEAYLYNTAQMLYRCVKKELSFKYYKLGFSAFCKKEKGKRVESL